MSDGEDDFMCEEEEDYGLVSFYININFNIISFMLFEKMYRLVFFFRDANFILFFFVFLVFKEFE